MELSDRDQTLLGGEHGEAAKLAMSLLVEMGRIQAASELIDIKSAHVDSCLYHGRAGLDFAETLVRGGAQVAVPTTLNVSSLDLLHPERYPGDSEDAVASRRQMDAYESMGCHPTWTCSPYQLTQRPAFGEQIAWGESNAIVFANSVLGARTERYGDFLDICCAITGRAPNVGLHTDSGRSASLVIDVRVEDALLSEDLLYPLLGGFVGGLSDSDVVAITGLDQRTTEDRLKALGAAAASTGSTGLVHVVGVTPEAPDLSSVVESDSRHVDVDLAGLTAVFRRFDRDSGPLGAVSVGTPHFSLSEFEQLAGLIDGRRARVPFMINTGRDTLAAIDKTPGHNAVVDFGAKIVTDTCVYLAPMLGELAGVMMTNSGKAAFYAPGNMGVGVAFGSLEDCVESAVAGEVVRTGPWS